MKTWVEAYTKCMDGEYFCGAYCPRDGHSNETSIEVARLVVLMREKDIVPSLEELVAHGFEGPLSDVLFIQFASRENMPNWLVPF